MRTEVVGQTCVRSHAPDTRRSVTPEALGPGAGLWVGSSLAVWRLHRSRFVNMACRRVVCRRRLSPATTRASSSRAAHLSQFVRM